MMQATQRKAGDRTYFLEYRDKSGFLWNDAPMGFRKLRHKVTVFKDDTRPLEVTLGIDAVGISMHESISPDEARILAAALLMAASHAESENEARIQASVGVSA